MISETIKVFYTKRKNYSGQLHRGAYAFISWTNHKCNAEEIDDMPGEKKVYNLREKRHIERTKVTNLYQIKNSE